MWVSLRVQNLGMQSTGRLQITHTGTCIIMQESTALRKLQTYKQKWINNNNFERLIGDCRFIQCTHTRIHHITQVDYDEFVSIVCSARNAFCMTPDGLTQFNEMLQGLRRSKSCKRELWQRIISALHNSSSI